VTLARRQFLRMAASAAALPVLPCIAAAQAYPVRPVRFVVGGVAGSPPDMIARLIGQWLSERLGRPFVMDNRPGAGGNIAIEAVARSAPDGHTLLLVPTSAAINATLYEKLSFVFLRDIAPVAGLIRVPAAMFVNSSFSPRSVPEFIAHAKPIPAGSLWRRRATEP
jgi:tripartite-type tricarboxylate transporter receptor subunit TctC